MPQCFLKTDRNPERKPKPERKQAPFAIVADELEAWKLKIYACNDTLQEQTGHYTVVDTADGRLLREGDFAASPNGVTLLCSPEIFYSERKILLFRWTLSDGTQGFNHYLCGYPPFNLTNYIRKMNEYRLGEA